MVFALFLTLHPSPAFADAVYFTSGEELKGLVVEEHRDRIVVSTVDGEQVIARREIDEIFFDDPERNYLYLGNRSLAGGDFSAAQGLFRKALQIYPEFQEADDALNRAADLEAKRGVPSLELSADLSGELLTRWGLRLKAGEGYPEVQSVEPGSQAQRAGIAAGDRLTAVWGESLSFLPVREAAYLILGPGGSMAKITLARQIALPPYSPAQPLWPGFLLSTERLGLIVTAVEPGSPASGAGLLAGDRVAAVDSQATRYLPLKEVQLQVEKARGQGLTLTVHRDLRVVRQ
jgi:membrane-associated protease RseP (regulator of RpoE activity)